PYTRNFHKPLTDITCEENVKNVAPLKNLLDFFGKKNSKVLEYWMDNSLFSNYEKPPKPFHLESSVMKEDVAFYDSLGFETITSFGCFLGEDYEELHGAPPVKEYADILLGK
ncbi:MAG: hypothetical protein MJ072_01260, partial [Clostridia bacterium]|nr:hypothetical protein [Clostridia bacterium]